MFTFDQVLDYWSITTPNSPAVRYQGADITWQALDDAVAVAAGRLASSAVGTGAHVAVLLENRPEFITYVLAAHRLGAVVIPINVRLVPREVAAMIERSDADVVVTSDKFAEHSSLTADTSLALSVLNVDRLDGLDGEAVRANSRPADPYPVAFICYTSGTTGAPKGAELTHSGVLAGAQKIMLSDRLSRDDRSLLALPLAFTGSTAVIWASVYLAGATLVLEREFHPERTLAALSRERITIFYGVPFLYQEMSRTAGFATADLSALRLGRVAAAPVPEELLRCWLDKEVPLSQGYGLTEGGACNLQLPVGREVDKRGFAGLPLLGGSTRIVDPDGNVCAPNTVGELWLQGPELMRGYYKNPLATAEVLFGGWLHTGDLAARDEEGFIKIVDRKSDMIITGGLNVYPAEVESVILALPGVLTAAVYGVPDDRWGEKVVATVVVSADTAMPEQDIETHCRTRIADYKIPRAIFVQDHDVPRNMAGKAMKSLLRQAAQASSLSVADAASGKTTCRGCSAKSTWSAFHRRASMAAVPWPLVQRR
jgi:fatty-acyl-CoA synthase